MSLIDPLNNTTTGDPRCPYCGRPVIGIFIQGIEGRYHPECTKPPTVFPTPYPAAPPLVDHTPKITCEEEGC